MSSGGRTHVGKLPAFGGFAKSCLLKTGYAFWTFHMSVFVNTTAMVVSYGTKLSPVWSAYGSG